MLRNLHRLIGFVMLFLTASVTFGQTVAAPSTAQSCNQACKQAKLAVLFKAMDDAEVSRRVGLSQSTHCAAYDGRDNPDVFTDVCAKLKYVRSLPIGTATHFSCPGNLAPLIGISLSRIDALWGEQDVVPDQELRRSGDELRVYFIGNPKLGELGGGFPELSLYIAHGVVSSAHCRLGSYQAD